MLSDLLSAAIVADVLARSTAVAARSAIHGPDHWERVMVRGKALASETPGADETVVLLFGLLHDCRRTSDDVDLDHGRAAAVLAAKLAREARLGPLTYKQIGCLENACMFHADGRVSDDPTCGVCWDADRLDLGRPGVNLRVDPTYLSTRAALEFHARQIVGQR